MPLKASLSFFSTIKTGGDFEDLRNNLWIMPLTGFIIGLMIALLSYPFFYFGIGFLIVVIYVAVEGINHIDGLADFFDSFFAPENKKIKALKDLQIGSGGLIAVTIYIIALSNFFQIIDNPIPAIILSQTLAKQGMLQLMLSSKPLWDGLAAEFMKGIKRRDYISYAFSISIALLLSLKYPEALLSLVVYFVLVYVFRYYVIKKYGGINGDMLGALNCLIFAGVLGVWCLQ